MTSETLWSQYTKDHPYFASSGPMTELSFAKSFLSTLDSRPLKLQSDHASDPKTLEITAPYTLPRMPTAFKKLATSGKDGDEVQKQTTINITLKSSKNPVMSLSLPSTDVGTSVLALKEKVAKELKIEGIDRIRVLYKRKPAGDVKTIKEVVGEDDVGQEVDFGVMVIGYKEDVMKKDEDTPMIDVEKPVAQGVSREEVLTGEDFWNDLRAFLLQRLQDEGKAVEVFHRFRESWERSGG